MPKAQIRRRVGLKTVSRLDAPIQRAFAMIERTQFGYLLTGGATALWWLHDLANEASRTCKACGGLDMTHETIEARYRPAR
jgi:hypothetical protein